MSAKALRIVRRALRWPLAAKLSGANAVLLLAAVGAFWAVQRGSHLVSALAVAAVALCGGVALNVALVTIALRPLHELEMTAQRVWRGELDARVRRSPVADGALERVSQAFNLLLDSVLADRTRIRALAAQVIETGDRERAALARELHDSTAQSIAGISYQLIAAEQMSRDPVLTAQLAEVRVATNAILEEVRLLSQSVYPRILDDLGLVSALRDLARRLGKGKEPPILVEVAPAADRAAQRLTADRAAVLYRVAREAVGNALRHARPDQITIRLDATVGRITLRVEDDGAGFTPAADGFPKGTGLFGMRERVSLVDGRFDVSSCLDGGTIVTASIPVTAPDRSSLHASSRE